MEHNRFDPLLLTDVPIQQLQNQRQPKPETHMFFQPSVMAESDDLCFSKIEECSLQNGACEAFKDKDCMDPIGNDVLDEISWRDLSSIAIGNDQDVLDDGNVKKEISWGDSISEEIGTKDGLDDGNVKKEISWGDSVLEEIVTEDVLDDLNVKKEISWVDSISEAIGTEDVLEDENVTKNRPDLVICSGSPDIPNRTYEDSPKLLKQSSLELSFENGITEGPKMKDYSHNTNEDLGSSEASFELLPLASCEENDEECDELMKAKRALETMKRENEHKSKECEEALKALRELQNELMRKSMHVGSLAFAVEGQVKEKSKWFSSLRDMSRKLKIMKMDQIKLLEEAEAYKKHAADMNDMSCIIQSRINEQVTQHEELKNRFNEGAKERKELYNKIQELKGNIRVFCRCRPLNSEEIAEGASMAFDFEASKDGELRVKSNVAFKKNFKFDSVFGPEANQVDVFEDTSSFATSVLDGYNVCIFAYGQTGTGKTFTMEGTNENRGVNFRTLEELFRVINERKNQIRYEISVGVMEVYNEQIRDLLLPSSQPGVAAKRLEIRQVGEGLHHVPGLVEAAVSNMGEVWEVLKTGSSSRAVGSTNANEHSSRSHCIHCVMVKGENLVSGECTRSKLWLVDLAGSERVAKTEVQGERLKETQNINRSLSALGDVISALATKSPHIPFRNSKLTHLLQDSLGGDSKTLMFVQISPNENDLSESLCSLNFASRVRGIELGPAKKQVESAEVLKYKQMAERYKNEMKNKDLQIKKMEDNVHGLDVKLKEKELKNKILQDKVKELESQLLVERKLARQHVDTKIAEQQMKQQKDDAVSTLSRQPLASKPLNATKINEESKENQSNIVQQPPLVDKNTAYKLPAPFPPARDLVNLDGNMENENENENEKENNSYFPEPFKIPKRTGRASICTTSQRVAVRSVLPRRNSLIPLPTTLAPAKFVPPLPSIESENEHEDRPERCVEPDSPKRSNGSGKKLMSALRRSFNKKNQMKSPLQQYARRAGGLNVPVDRVRVSIGSRARMGHRLVANGRRIKQQNNCMDKERRWNIGKGGL
ncbi:putative minus-end-directed kinesin ATPase [Helianthus annuus]|nr:putative minus-end-directed kinesin ATPase [Helianthus annuus]